MTPPKDPTRRAFILVDRARIDLENAAARLRRVIELHAAGELRGGTSLEPHLADASISLSEALHNCRELGGRLFEELPEGKK